MKCLQYRSKRVESFQAFIDSGENEPEVKECARTSGRNSESVKITPTKDGLRFTLKEMTCASRPLGAQRLRLLKTLNYFYGEYQSRIGVNATNALMIDDIITVS